jgi:hypothetical protein
MRFVTWDVMHLYRSGLPKAVASELAKHKLDIVAVQEVRWEKGGSQLVGNHISVYGNWNADHCLGTCFFVHERIRSAVMRVECISDRMSYTKCGYEVLGMILLQAYLYTYNLLRWVTFEALPLRSCALSPPMLSLFITFLKHLLWDSFQYHHHFFIGCLQYPEIVVPLRQTLFLNTARSHLEPNQGNGVSTPFQ